MKKLLVILMVLSVAMMAFAQGGSEAQTTKAEEPTGPIQVEFWSTWTGGTGEKVQQMADDFNASQDKYVVTVVYNGGYADSWAKLVSLPREEWPELVFMNAERMASLLYEDGLCTPMQKFVDEDKYDLSDIQASLIGHYSDSNGNLIMMPMGNTVVGFFYNAEMCAAAGVDPYSIKHFPDLLEAARTVAAKTDCKTPVALGRNAIYYTFLITAEGLKVLDNNNGRDAFPTKVLLDQPEQRKATIEYFETIQALAKEGLMHPYAGSTQDLTDRFGMQQCCFEFMTCSICSGVYRVAQANGMFDFGFLPAPSASADGTVLATPSGGGGLFIPANGDDAAQRGAWEFVKFITQPKYTSIFARQTGYLPITKSTANEAEYQEYMKTVFKTAQYVMDFQAASDPSASYTMAWPSGMDPSTVINQAIDAVMADPTLDIPTVVDGIQAALQEQLDLVNAIR